MDLMMELQQAFNFVSNGNNQSIKKGEQMLAKLKRNSDYPVLLLNYMKESHNNPQGKLRSSIQLKLWCRYYQSLQQYERQYFKHVIENVKYDILLAYLGYRGKIQKTLLPGIVSLADVQFPDKWGTLVTGLIHYCREQDNNSTLNVLELLKQITQKYNYSSRSDPLYRQINKVCDQVHDFLLQLTQKLATNIVNVQHIPDNLKILQVLMRLFYNLNYQDLHPKFQDNLQNWMKILNIVMKLPNGNEGFFKCKGGALQSILLYASKYKQDVQDSIKGFSSQIWNLCSDAVNDPQYDDVVFNSLKYFRSLIMWPDMKQFFSNNIQNLIKNLILPNININRNSMQLFNQQTQTFIAYYFRNAQINTRRSAALQLLRSICRNFPNFSVFISEQVQGFNIENNNIQSQCLLLNLIMQSSAKAFRDVDGVTQLFIDQNIINYCYQNFVKTRLQQFYKFSFSQDKNNFIQSNFNIIHVVMILRYVYYFRIYLPVQDLILILQLCCTIKSQNFSLKAVIFLVINAFITIRHGDFMFFKQIKPYFNDNTLGDTTVSILKTVYENSQLQQKLNQNLTKILYNISKHLGKACVKYYDYFSYIFDQMLKKTVQYDFASISGLFQSLGIVSYFICTQKSQNLSNLQSKIYDYFQNAIKSQSDIVNFCFQILSIFAKYSNQNKVNYSNIYYSIIQQNNWNQQNLSIMSSYAQYMSVYFSLNQNVLLDDKVSLIKIFQRLVFLDRFDLFFRLLDDILKITGVEGFANLGYFDLTIHSSVDIMTKSPLAIKTALSFIFTLTCKYNIQLAIKYMNQSIPNFYQICLLQNKTLVQTLQAKRQRKLMYGSICNALVTGCFSNIQNQATILNLLIDNSTGKFRFQKLSESIKQNEIKEKKESAFKKLQILKQTQKNEDDFDLDQEVTLVRTYSQCIKRNQNLSNFIPQNNLERMKRLYQKHQSR